MIVSADDLGLSQGITDGIPETFDNGYLTSTSVIAQRTARFAPGKWISDDPGSLLW